MHHDKSLNLALVPTAKGDELIGFPDTVLASLAEFLTKTERALVAVAMTASSKSWRESNWRKRPLDASSVMIAARPLNEININRRMRESYEWDSFDFRDIDKSLAKKLSDEDIGGLLVCLDAINTVKVFKLKGCVNIIGHGLEPLRGSRVLEQLDLNPDGNEVWWEAGKSTIHPCWHSGRIENYFTPLLPLLSEAAIIPILDSILDDERSALGHLSFPKKWRLEQSSSLSGFLVKYSRTKNRHELTCSNPHTPPCGSTCLHLPWVPLSGRCYGIQQFSCYECRGHFCEEHSAEMTPHVCEVCESTYCSNCNDTSTCDVCHNTTCHNCTDVAMCGICLRELCGPCCTSFYCEDCENVRCEECAPTFFCEREGCDRMNCNECTAVDDASDCFVEFCFTCSNSFCGEHLVFDAYLLGNNDYCKDCNARALLILKQMNTNILQSLHEWEALCGYQERFESDLKSEEVAKLFEEQIRMKQRWDQLYNMSTSEQRKNKKCIGSMFIVERSPIA